MCATLVLAYRHQARLVGEDVRALQQRVSKKSEGREIALLELLLLVLEARDALQPTERSDHREQDVQLRVLGDARLDEKGRIARVDARSQPVDDHVPHVLADDLGVVVVGGQRVPVRHEEEALVLVLQPDPVLEHPVVVPEVELPGGPHPGEDATMGRVKRIHGSGNGVRAKGTRRCLWFSEAGDAAF